MKIYSYIIFIILINLPFAENITGQSITNVIAKMEDNQIIVNYDIVHFNSQEYYKIRIYFVDNNSSKMFPVSLSGDINYVSGGNNKKIIWDIKKDIDYLIGNIKPVLRIMDTYIKLGEASNAFLSIIVPGFGDYRVSTKYNSPINIRTISSYSMLAYGFVARSLSEKYYSQYMEKIDQSEIDAYYKKANSFHYQSYAAWGIGLAIWAYDIIWVLCKGTANAKKNRGYFGLENLNYNINDTNDGILFTLCYRF